MMMRCATLILATLVILPYVPSPALGQSYVAPAPSPNYANLDPSMYCGVNPSGYCYNRLYPFSPPSQRSPQSLNADDLRAMLEWRNANQFMASFNDSPCSWRIVQPTVNYSASVVTCSPANYLNPNSELRVTALYINGLYHLNFSDSVTSRVNWTATAGLSALTSINVINTQFEGNLPAEWSGLTKLTYIGISNTTFGGQIPQEWFSSGALPVLSSLNLKDNNFSGSLPEVGDGALSSLTTLTLTNNQFSGQLPESWTKLVNVSFLYLQQNQLSGVLPESWGANTSFGSLYQLNLSRNNFEGNLPESWGSPLAFSRNDNRPGLSYYQALNSRAKPLNLWVERNPGLTGPIPSSWSDSGLKAGNTVELAYSTYPLLTIFVQPQTGICGSVPPYVIALTNNVLPLGQANALQPTNTIGRASLTPCQNNTGVSG